MVGGSFRDFFSARSLALRAESTGYIGVTSVCGFPLKLAILS